MDGTTSLPLAVSSTHTPRPLPVPVVFFLLFFFLLLLLLSHQHNLSLSSVPASCGPSARFLYGFSLSLSPTPPPPPELPLALNGGFWTPQWSEERPFLHRLSFSTHPNPCFSIFSFLPAFFFLHWTRSNNHSSCILNNNITVFITYSHLSFSLLSFLWPSLCASMPNASFHWVFCCYLYCWMCVCVWSAVLSAAQLMSDWIVSKQ